MWVSVRVREARVRGDAGVSVRVRIREARVRGDAGVRLGLGLDKLEFEAMQVLVLGLG